MFSPLYVLMGSMVHSRGAAVSSLVHTDMPLRLGLDAAGFGALFGGRNLRPLLIGSSLMLFQQITGDV